MSWGVLCILSVVLLAAQQPRTPGKTPVASLSAYGVVTVDGRKMPTGATVFEGQTVATTPESTALVALSRDKARLALGKASAAEIAAQALRLKAGIGRFVGFPDSRALWFASELLLRPEGVATAEAIIQPDGQVKVQVDEGTVTVLGPGGNVLRTLAKGQAHLFGRVERRSGGTAPGTAGGAAAGTAAGSAAGGAASGGLSTGAWVAIGAAAAGATATGAVVATKRGS
jgi:hypothetical protein